MATPNQPEPTPTLAGAINLSIENFMMGMHTAMPAKVHKVNLADGTIDAKPLLKRKYVHEDEPHELPVITRVPLAQFSMGNAWVRVPVAPGDTVLLIFAERSIDKWYENGGIQDPEDVRKFDLADAIAIPGLRPRPAAIVPKGAASSLEIANGRTWIEITATGKVKITNGSVELLGILDALIGHLIAMQVLTTNGPAGLTPASALQLQQDQIALEELAP